MERGSKPNHRAFRVLGRLQNRHSATRDKTEIWLSKMEYSIRVLPVKKDSLMPSVIVGPEIFNVLLLEIRVN